MEWWNGIVECVLQGERSLLLLFFFFFFFFKKVHVEGLITSKVLKGQSHFSQCERSLLLLFFFFFFFFKKVHVEGLITSKVLKGQSHCCRYIFFELMMEERGAGGISFIPEQQRAQIWSR